MVRNIAAITTNTRTLPSGPTLPPVIHFDPWKSRIKESAHCFLSTVGNAVKEAFTPIPRGVHSDGEPKISGAPQAENEYECIDRRGNCAEPVFSAIQEMDAAKESA